MFSVADFISKDEIHSDDELLEIHNNKAGYSAVLQEALSVVIDKEVVVPGIK